MPTFRQEVVDVLFNRDKNLLCRIGEMRKSIAHNMEKEVMRDGR